MASSAVVSAQNGDIYVYGGDSIDDVASIGRVSTLADVAIYGGSIVDADDASAGEDSHVDVEADSLYVQALRGLGLQSGNQLGAAVNALESDVTTLAALVGGRDGVYVREQDGLRIGDTNAVVTQTVQADGSLVALTVGSESDVLTSGSAEANGSIVVEVLAGDLTVSDGSAALVGVGVQAHGIGNIRLSALGSGASLYMSTGADVVSAGGHITLMSAETVDLGSAVDVSTQGIGSVDISAVAGDVLMTATSTVNTVNGDIRIRGGDAVGDRIVLGDIVATNGNVSVVTTGSILAALDADAEVRANALTMEAGKGIGLLSGNSLGLAVQAIETQVGRLSARVYGSDGINIEEADGLTVGAVVSQVVGTSAVTVYRVGVDGSLSAQSEATRSDVVTESSFSGGATERSCCAA